MLKFIFKVFSLLILIRTLFALDVDSAQSYSLLAKPSVENWTGVNSYLSTQLKGNENKDGVVMIRNNQSMDINKNEQSIMQNGKIELIQDTQMQISPNGVNLKVKY